MDPSQVHAQLLRQRLRCRRRRRLRSRLRCWCCCLPTRQPLAHQSALVHAQEAHQEVVGGNLESGIRVRGKWVQLNGDWQAKQARPGKLSGSPCCMQARRASPPQIRSFCTAPQRAHPAPCKGSITGQYRENKGCATLQQRKRRFEAPLHSRRHQHSQCPNRQAKCAKPHRARATRACTSPTARPASEACDHTSLPAAAPSALTAGGDTPQSPPAASRVPLPPAAA